MNRALFKLALLIVAAGLSGCIDLSPNYQRPAPAVAPAWPAGMASEGPEVNVPDLGWRDFFKDPRLQDVIVLALQNNRDLRIAALNIEKSLAEYHIQAAELFPSISLSASETAQRTPALSSGGTSNSSASVSHTESVQLGFSSYQIDLFGQLRNLKQQDWQNYLATAETRRSTQLSLIATVANDWLTLASDLALLELDRQTLAADRKNDELTQLMHDVGSVDGLSLIEAQGALESARRAVAAAETQVVQDRDALELEMGTSLPDADLPGANMDDVLAIHALPAGIPSQVLLQRPDVKSAEHTLLGANADIGAARAAFFPSITLTASAGTESNGLSRLFKRGSGAWLFEPDITLPIFDAGTLAAELKEAKVNRDLDVAQYQQTIQSAFRDAADALATRASIATQLEAQHAAVEANKRSYALTLLRFQQGTDSMLDVITTQLTLYTAQQTMIGVQLSDQTSLINLYNALGGGWNEFTANN